MTVVEAANHPAVETLHGDDKRRAHLWVYAEIVRLFKWMNFSESKLPDQDIVMDWAMDLITQYKYLSLEEFAVFFRQARTGHIKIDMFERVGYDVLKATIDKYIAKRQRKLKPQSDQNKRDGYDVSKYADMVRETLKKNAPEPNPVRKESKQFSTMSYAKEMEELKESLPLMSDAELQSALNAYKSLRSFGEHEAVKWIEDEMDRRSS